MPRLQLGRYVRYRRAAVLAWLDAHEMPPSRPRASSTPKEAS
jgi:hypothetical protein